MIYSPCPLPPVWAFSVGGGARVSSVRVAAAQYPQASNSLSYNLSLLQEGGRTWLEFSILQSHLARREGENLLVE